MPKNDFITVVFKCPTDSELRNKITTHFKDNKKFMGAQITAVSLEGSAHETEKIIR